LVIKKDEDDTNRSGSVIVHEDGDDLVSPTKSASSNRDVPDFVQYIRKMSPRNNEKTPSSKIEAIVAAQKMES